MTLLIGRVITKGGSSFLFTFPFFGHLLTVVVHILCTLVRFLYGTFNAFLVYLSKKVFLKTSLTQLVSHPLFCNPYLLLIVLQRCWNPSKSQCPLSLKALFHAKIPHINLQTTSDMKDRQEISANVNETRCNSNYHTPNKRHSFKEVHQKRKEEARSRIYLVKPLEASIQTLKNIFLDEYNTNDNLKKYEVRNEWQIWKL